MRQSSADFGIWARTHAQVLPAGGGFPEHAHAWGQLAYCADGLLALHTDAGRWVLPPRRALWIPPGVRHAVEARASTSLRSVYLVPRLATRLPGEPTVVDVSPVLRELLLEIAYGPPLSGRVGPERRAVGFLVDQLTRRPALPLRLALPADPRALRLADAVLAAPGDRRDIEALARTCGASRRTLERHFRRETGLSIGAWRRRARLLDAVERLAAGEPVTQVALAVGYDNPSAFVAMFARNLGTTPGRYAARRDPPI